MGLRRVVPVESGRPVSGSVTVKRHDVNDLSAHVNETAGRDVELVVKVIEQRTLTPGSAAACCDNRGRCPWRDGVMV